MVRTNAHVLGNLKHDVPGIWRKKVYNNQLSLLKGSTEHTGLAKTQDIL